MNRRKVAWFLVILAVFIFVGSPFSQSAQAVAVVDDALIAIIIAALAALGITFVASSSYNSLSEYVSSLLDDYATSRGMSTPQLFSGVQSGANTLGQILINNRFVQLIEGFAAYLKLRFNLVDNSSVTLLSPSITVGNFVSYELPFEAHRPRINDGQMYDTIIASDEAYAILYYTNSNRTSVRAFLVSAVNCYVQLYQIYNTGEVVENQGAQELTYESTLNLYQRNGWTSWTTYQSNQNGYDFTGYVIYDSYDDVWAGLEENSDLNTVNMTIGINTGEIVLPSDDPDYTDGDGAVIDVGGKWGETYPEITDNTIPLEWAPGDAGEASIFYEDEVTVNDQVETGANTSYVSDNPGEYAVIGLQNVFPFCIPFDIYAFFECLAADPVAPVVNWRFYVPGICDETITLDLSQFNTVAQIVRTMELLAFIVGLALVTREKFLRG